MSHIDELRHVSRSGQEILGKTPRRQKHTCMVGRKTLEAKVAYFMCIRDCEARGWGENALMVVRYVVQVVLTSRAKVEGAAEALTLGMTDVNAPR